MNLTNCKQKSGGFSHNFLLLKFDFLPVGLCKLDGNGAEKLMDSVYWRQAENPREMSNYCEKLNLLLYSVRVCSHPAKMETIFDRCNLPGMTFALMRC